METRVVRYGGVLVSSIRYVDTTTASGGSQYRNNLKVIENNKVIHGQRPQVLAKHIVHVLVS